MKSALNSKWVCLGPKLAVAALTVLVRRIHKLSIEKRSNCACVEVPQGHTALQRKFAVHADGFDYAKTGQFFE